MLNLIVPYVYLLQAVPMSVSYCPGPKPFMICKLSVSIPCSLHKRKCIQPCMQYVYVYQFATCDGPRRSPLTARAFWHSQNMVAHAHIYYDFHSRKKKDTLGYMNCIYKYKMGRSRHSRNKSPAFQALDVFYH